MTCEVFWVMLTAIASWFLVGVTWLMIKKQVMLGQTDLKVRLQMSFEEKFGGSNMIEERKKLAGQIIGQTKHEDIQEPILNFFESIGILLRRKYLDREMVWAGFAFYAIRWWSASKDYIFEERRRKNNDNTIFEDFNYLIDELYKIEMQKRSLTRAELEPSQDDIKRFLDEEKNL